MHRSPELDDNGTPPWERLRLAGDPVAAPEAQVRSGSARFTVLTSRLLRMEWSPDAGFDDRATYAFPNRRVEVPGFDLRREQGATVLETADLRLRHLLDGRPFHAGNLSVELLGGEPRTRWTPGAVDRWNLGGARRTVDGRWGEGRLEPGLASRSGWAVVDDGAGFRFNPGGGWVAPRPPDDGRQDWYFFGYGHSYADAVSEYVTRFGGHVPLLPRWVLGFWWSRYWAYRDEELRTLVQEFRDHAFPLDVLVIDMDWHTQESWTGYTWNRELFPDPAGFLAWAHEHHLHVTLNLHPARGVARHEAVYPEFARALGLDPSSVRPVPFRIADPRFVRAYLELLHHPLEDEGVDFWWMDWQQGRTSEIPGLDPLPWLNHLHSRDLLRRPDRRQLVLSRWGGLGSHRYPVGFSGDSAATWASLRFQPRYTAAGANVAYGWWSHDIGGHFGADDPELYIRWVQFGALSPVLRLHSTNTPESERRPWAFGPEVERIAREAFQMRAELLPYLYTSARQTSDEGIALVRPMSWVAPEHDSAYLARDQYLLGDDLLVAPVVEPADPATGLAEKDVWLPPGEWVERTTGETVIGPRWVRRFADLATVPQFLRAGTILPLGEPALNAAEQPADHLLLSVAPGAAGSTRVYHDDGTTRAHLDGESGWTSARVTSPDPSSCTIEVEPAPQVRRLTLRLEHTNRPERVVVSGRSNVGWRHDEASGRTTIAVEDPGGRVRVEVRARGPLSRRGEDHDRRLREADLARPGVEPAGLAAIARSGGALVHVVEHRAPEEAERTLGYVVVAAPQSGGTARASVVWTLERGGERRAFPVEATIEGSDHTFEAPFRWDGTLGPVRWSVEIRAEWDGGKLIQRHRAGVLNPTLPAWRLSWGPLPDGGHPSPAVASDAAADSPVLPWQSVQVEPQDPDFGELGEPFLLWFRRVLPAHEDAVGWAVASFTVPSERPVAFSYLAGGPTEVWCSEDLEPDLGGVGPAAFADPRPQWRRTSAVTLPAGRQRVVFRCGRPDGPNAFWWFLAASVVDPVSGDVIVDVEPGSAGPGEWARRRVGPGPGGGGAPARHCREEGAGAGPA